jgi:hypothetical protein
MTKLTDESYVAKHWVEANFPSAQGNDKASLIIAFGAGLDRGMAEAMEMLAEVSQEIRELASRPHQVS